MQRIDWLADAPAARFLLLTGRILDVEPDAELQALAAQAARETRTSIAFLGLPLAGITLLRAHTGLPKDLAVLGAVDRDVSFCQLPMRGDGIVEIRDTADDLRVPQALVRRFKLRAYLGAPVHVGGRPVGALGVAATAPRMFPAGAAGALAEIAARAGRRLEALSSGPAAGSEQAARALVLAAESAAFARARAADTTASRALDLLHDGATSAARLHDAIEALDAAARGAPAPPAHPASLGEALAAVVA